MRRARLHTLIHPHPMLDHDVFDGFNCSHFPLGLVEPGGQTHRLIQREGGDMADER